MKKIVIDGKECIINDDIIDEKKTGVIISRDEEPELEKTLEINPISEEELLENTLVDFTVNDYG